MYKTIIEVVSCHDKNVMIQINVTLFHIFKENKKVKMLIWRCIDWLLNDFISFFRHDSLIQKFTLNNILHLQINIKKCNNKNNLIKFKFEQIKCYQ